MVGFLPDIKMVVGLNPHQRQKHVDFRQVGKPVLNLWSVLM